MNSRPGLWPSQVLLSFSPLDETGMIEGAGASYFPSKAKGGWHWVFPFSHILWGQARVKENRALWVYFKMVTFSFLYQKHKGIFFSGFHANNLVGFLEANLLKVAHKTGPPRVFFCIKPVHSLQKLVNYPLTVPTSFWLLCLLQFPVSCDSLYSPVSPVSRTVIFTVTSIVWWI